MLNKRRGSLKASSNLIEVKQPIVDGANASLHVDPDASVACRFGDARDLLGKILRAKSAGVSVVSRNFNAFAIQSRHYVDVVRRRPFARQDSCAAREIEQAVTISNFFCMRSFKVLITIRAVDLKNEVLADPFESTRKQESIARSLFGVKI